MQDKNGMSQGERGAVGVPGPVGPTGCPVGARGAMGSIGSRHGLGYGIYRHYKGDLYFVTGFAIDATNESADETPFVMVVYQRDYALFVRDEDEFVEVVKWPDGEMRPRFVRVTD